MKKIFLLILLIIAFLSGRRVYTIFNQYEVDSSYYVEIQEDYVENISTTPSPTSTVIVNSIFTVETPSPTPLATLEPSSTPLTYKKLTTINPHTTAMKPPIEINFKKLKRINSEIVGWIYSKDTPINYPVLQSSDNVKYLHHLMNGKYSISGSIFLDCVCNSNFMDDNSILYGHHMRNGSMFASLKRYEEQEYYDNHNQLWLLTPNQDYLIVPFSGMVVSSRAHYYTNVIENKKQFIKEAVSHSLFTPITIPNIADKLITLSTCDYTFDDARFILLGILIPVR